MIAIDTNILLRLFVEDTPEQSVAARRLMKEAIATATPVLLPPLVMAETAWALKSNFGKDKSVVLSILNEIIDNSAFIVDDRESVIVAIDAWTNGRADFADYLIAAMARRAGCRTTFTFDTEAAKMRPAITLLEF